MKLRNKLAAALMTTYLTGMALLPAQAANVEVEAMHGNTYNGQTENVTTLDTKVGSNIRNLGYFFRNITTADHTEYEDGADNNVNAFSLVDLTYPLGAGFDAVGEIQLPAGAPADPRAGLQFCKSADDVLVYALATRNFTADPNTELVGLFRYTPAIKDDLKIFGQVEAIVKIGDKDYNFDSTKVRLGIDKDGNRIGVAGQINGLGTGNEPEYGLGVFAGKEFK